MSDNEITAEQLRTISDYLSDVSDVHFREDDDLGVFRTYSGRGMYGKECIGLVISANDVFNVAMNLAGALIRADADYELIEAFKRVRTDSMGYDTVFYWTNISLAADEDDEDEDEAEGQEYQDALSGS